MALTTVNIVLPIRGDTPHKWRCTSCGSPRPGPAGGACPPGQPQFHAARFRVAGAIPAYRRRAACAITAGTARDVVELERLAGRVRACAPLKRRRAGSMARVEAPQTNRTLLAPLPAAPGNAPGGCTEGMHFRPRYTRLRRSQITIRGNPPRSHVEHATGIEADAVDFARNGCIQPAHDPFQQLDTKDSRPGPSSGRRTASRRLQEWRAMHASRALQDEVWNQRPLLACSGNARRRDASSVIGRAQRA